MGTENEVAMVSVSMLFCTCTTASPEPPPVEDAPVPARLAVCGLFVALSLTTSVAVRPWGGRGECSADGAACVARERGGTYWTIVGLGKVTRAGPAEDYTTNGRWPCSVVAQGDRLSCARRRDSLVPKRQRRGRKA